MAERDPRALDPRLLELIPPLGAHCPPPAVIDKTLYSGFAEPQLLAHLRAAGRRACRVRIRNRRLRAVDLGYRVVVVRDAMCSSSDEGHDMLMRLYQTRFTEQIETADAEMVLSRWR